MDTARPAKPKRARPSAESAQARVGAVLRPDVIAYARTLLAAGLAGADAERLANRLIDVALNEGEWLWSVDR
jgi:hypothetical protein